MKRLLVVLLSALMYCRVLHAQILYACTKAGSDTTIYVLGTHHVMPRDSFGLDVALIDSLIERSDVVFSEYLMPYDTIGYGATRAKFMALWRYPDGQSLRTTVSSRVYDSIALFYKMRYSISKKRFRQYSIYRPFIMDVGLSHRIGRDFRMDPFLYDLALKKKKW